jgi:hypothetical protein
MGGVYQRNVGRGKEMKETVFIVEGASDHESSDRFLVFRTREKAEQFVKQQPEFTCYGWFIHECEIED